MQAFLVEITKTPTDEELKERLWYVGYVFSSTYGFLKLMQQLKETLPSEVGGNSIIVWAPTENPVEDIFSENTGMPAIQDLRFLFGRYFFIGASVEEDLMGGLLMSANYGSCTFLSMNEAMIVSVPYEQMVYVRLASSVAKLLEEVKLSFKEGDIVEIIGGPLIGIVGTCIYDTSKNVYVNMVIFKERLDQACIPKEWCRKLDRAKHEEGF